ncbi:MAG: hypothetical protein Q7S14_00945 [bacterium]|nr:hypothetical protein [bacterium]
MSLLFLAYSILSWVLLFRDLWTLEVIATKFYPQWAGQINAIEKFLQVFKLNTVPTALFILIIVGLFILYFKIIKNNLSKKTIIFWGLVFQAIVFFSYPILSTDVLSYILSDRINVVYHKNVWTTKPNEFVNDPYFYLVYPIYKDQDWTNMTRIYGGVNQAIYTPVTALSGGGLIANLISHKLAVFVFVIATMLVIPSAVVFLNPLFIIETIGSGHNDIIMLFFTVVSLTVVNPIASGLFLGLATQVKTTPVLLFVFLAISLVSQLKLKKLVLFSLSYVFTVGIIYYFMGVNPLDTVIRMGSSINVYWQSLPMLIRSPVLNYLLIIFLAFQAFRTLIYRLNVIEIFAQTLMIYLLFFLSAFWNWYPIWLLVLVPFLPEKSKIKPYILAFTFSSMLGYAAYWISLRFNYQFFLWPVIIYLTVLSGPLIVCLKNIKEKYL